jgi:hypothetical protein
MQVHRNTLYYTISCVECELYNFFCTYRPMRDAIGASATSRKKRSYRKVGDAQAAPTFL